MNEPAVMRAMLAAAKEDGRGIAVIGISEDAQKPSHYVSASMQEHGYRILPVNPVAESVLGERSYASLTDLVANGGTPGIVNVFRLPKFVPGIVDEMIALGLKDLWVQLGIVHPESAQRAEAAGIRVVMDRCIMVEHRRLGL